MESPNWKNGWQYKTVKTYIDKVNAVTYGLVLCTQDGVELERVEDVTTDQSFAEDMAKLFTSQCLEPIHFFEVVEDMIACPEALYGNWAGAF